MSYLSFIAISSKEIISIDRRILNELLIEGKFPTEVDTRVRRFVLEAAKRPEINIHFQYKFLHWNREDKVATFQKYSIERVSHRMFIRSFSAAGESVEFNVDALIGYDG